MKKKYTRALAAALAAVMIWNTCDWHPQALAGSSVQYIEEVKELSEDILHQEVPYGTKYKDLELPDKLKVRVLKEDASDKDERNDETDGGEIKATASEISINLENPSKEEKTGVYLVDELQSQNENGGKVEAQEASPSEMEKEDKEASKASPSDADDASSDASWKEIRVRWVLDETFSEKEKYDGTTPGIYVFDAEVRNSRYELGSGFLPRIEVTVLPEEKLPQILSWEWIDEQKALIDGELQLAVTEEDQIPFEEIVSMLPERILANVCENDENDEPAETEIALSGWNCDEYKEDEEGKYPTEGEFLFQAELPEDYELDADAKALQVKVVLEEPGIVPLENLGGVLAIYPKGQSFVNLFPLTNNKYTGDGYTIEKLSEDNYQLTLKGINADRIDINRGTWTVVLQGNNTLMGREKGIQIASEVKSAAFEGAGNLKLQGTDSGLVIGTGTSLTMRGRGKIEAVSTNKGDPRDAGLYISNTGRLTIESGTVNISGGDYGLSVGTDTNINVSGGQVITTGDTNAYHQDAGSTLNITGGSVTCNGMVLEANGNNKIEINGAGAKLTVNGDLLAYQPSSKVILKSGELQLNGGVLRGDGTFAKEGGSLTGTGSLADDKKLDLNITVKSVSKTIKVGQKVEPESYFDIPSVYGTLSYTVSEGTELAHIDIASGKLIADSVGAIKLKITSAATRFYKEATQEVELIIEKGTLADASIALYSGTYDGKEHDAVRVEKVDGKTPSDDMTIRYAKVGNGVVGNFTEDMPKVKDCSDSGVTYRVEISSKNYQTMTFNPQGMVRISPFALKNAEVTLDNTEFTYNGEKLVPTITAKIPNGTLIPSDSYTVSYEKQENESWIACTECVNVGTYREILTAVDSQTNNFTGTVISSTFEIKAKALTPSITGTLTKTYNGWVDVNDDVKIILMDGSTPVEGVKAAATIVYDDPNAGDNKKITASKISITSGNDTGNYTLNETTATAYGKIEKATLENVSVQQMGVLYYNGTEQTADVETRAEAPYDGGTVKFTYALLNDSFAEFTESVPAFTNRGDYVVHYKASLTNYEDEIGMLHITILPGNLADASVTLSSETSVYTGKEQKPSVKKVTLNGVDLPETDYEVTYRRERRESGDVIPKEAGKYRVVVVCKKDRDNLDGSAEAAFTITEKSIAGDDIEILLSEKDLPYDTTEKHPTIEVIDHSRNEKLIPEVDYTVSMPESTYPGENYEITISGQGNYGGTKKAYYNIIRPDLKDAKVTVYGTYVYRGTAVELDSSMVWVELNGTVVDPSEYEITYTDNMAIGTANVLIQAKENGNYTGSVSGTFEILDPKTHQNAVSSEVTFSQNPDNQTFTATIQAVDGAEYSFDGVNWSDSNQKTDCQSNTPYSAFIRMKETDTSHAGPATELKFMTPELKKSSSRDSSGGRVSSSLTATSVTTRTDSVKGKVNSDKGILTGANNSTANDGYSHWMQDEHGWWLRFADNSYPKAAMRGTSGIAYAWEQVNGNWWAFDENGYIKTGWMRDEDYGGWFYADLEHGMLTGWHLIDGKWYYFHLTSDGRKGLMYAGRRTPDGYYVDENGAWDGR